MMKHEKQSWKTMLEITPQVMRLLVTEPEGDVLKAEFTTYPDHIRALLFMLEGLALWSGQKLCVAIHAKRPVDHSLGLGAFGGQEWPEESALVEFVFVETEPKGRRKIAGVGEFRQLRLLDRYGITPR